MRGREVAQRLDRMLVGLGASPVDTGSLESRLNEVEAAIRRIEDRLAIARAERELMAEGLDQLAVGVVVAVGSEVALRNAAAQRYADASDSEVLVEAGVRELIAALGSGGSTETRQIRLMGPPPRILELEGGPTPAGHTVVIIRDVTANERLDHVRRDFVANTSHELRTPIGALTLLAETLVDETDPRTIEDLSERVLTEAQRAGRIVDDLLVLSKVESGSPIQPTILAVRDLVADAIDLVRSSAEACAVTVDGDVDQQLLVEGQRRELVAALVNVLDNAIRYSDPGDQVTITGELADTTAEIRVVDDGIGIPARDLDRVFERFYRVDRARSRDRGGTGLGLSIVRHVIENHGGSASITSTEGRGSTVLLALPGSRIPEEGSDG